MYNYCGFFWENFTFKKQQEYIQVNEVTRSSCTETKTHEPITARYLCCPPTRPHRGWSGCVAASFVCTVCVGQCDTQMFLHRERSVSDTRPSCGSYGVYMAVTGSPWLVVLQGLGPTLLRKNHLAWLLRDTFTCMCDHSVRNVEYLCHVHA